MKFFQSTPKSTANEILDFVEEKICAAIAKNPQVKDYDWDHDILRLFSALSDAKKCKEALETILKINFPDALYKTFKTLNKSHQKEIQEKIADAYYKLLESLIGKIETTTVEISFEVIEKSSWGREVTAIIPTPPELTNTDSLNMGLSHTLAKIQRELIQKKSDAIQWKSTL